MPYNRNINEDGENSMSIINSYNKNGKPMISVEQIYRKSETKFDVCIFTFSKRVIKILLEDNLIEVVSEDTIHSISENYPVYRFIGTNIGIIKTSVGAPMAAGLMIEVSHVFSCKKIVMFGSCGSLDKSISPNMLIIPTHAYRDEGTSYHYKEPSDYIDINNYHKVCQILDDLSISYVTGRTWTTDAFYRETIEEMMVRKEEVCIAVEMEVSACQAVCSYSNIEFYCFLYRADNLDSSSWEKGQRDRFLSKDERLKILNVAFEIARNV